MAIEPGVYNFTLQRRSDHTIPLIFKDGDNNAIEDATTGISVATNVSIDVDNDGGNEARPRNVAMMYIIKV